MKTHKHQWLLNPLPLSAIPPFSSPSVHTLGTLPTLRKDRQLAHSPCTFPPAGGDNFLARHFQLNFPLHVLVVVVLTRDAIFFDHFAFHNRDMVHPDTLGIV